jgi:beta-galactosidase/beta-glucuronidase
MTGLSNYEAALKNIRQAKKYGFNLVRFHSTVPSEDFMRAADELGFLVHMEIGFTYDFDENGNKQNLSMNNKLNPIH